MHAQRGENTVTKGKGTEMAEEAVYTNLKKSVARRSGRGGVLPEMATLVSFRAPTAANVAVVIRWESASSRRFNVLDARMLTQAVISDLTIVEGNGLGSDPFPSAVEYLSVIGGEGGGGGGGGDGGDGGAGSGGGAVVNEAGGDISDGMSAKSKLSSACSPSVVVTIVSIVLALSVLVLIVVSEAVLEPITTTFGTVRQLRLPPADLKCNLRSAEAACDKKSLSREFSAVPLCRCAVPVARDACGCGCGCDCGCGCGCDSRADDSVPLPRELASFLPLNPRPRPSRHP